MSPSNKRPLPHLATLTQDYGRMLNRSTGLCSLWTGACLASLTVLGFAWTWQHYQALERPGGYYALYLLRTRETLPLWILAIAFLLPFLWAPVMRGLSALAYPERFGTVRAKAPEWLGGLEEVVPPRWARWAPFLLLTGFALSCGILLPLFGRVIGNPPEMNAFLWRAFLAPLLGLFWVWLVPRLRKAEASEGSILVYVAAFMMCGRDLSGLIIILPLYVFLALITIAYGLWAHGRYRRALAELESSTPETADV